MLDRDSIHILYRVSGYGSIPQSTDGVRGLASSPDTLTKLNPSLLHHERSFTVFGIFIRWLKNFLIPLGRNIYCSYKCLVKQPEDKCHTSSPTINSVHMCACVCFSLCTEANTFVDAQWLSKSLWFTYYLKPCQTAHSMHQVQNFWAWGMAFFGVSGFKCRPWDLILQHDSLELNSSCSVLPCTRIQKKDKQTNN